MRTSTARRALLSCVLLCVGVHSSHAESWYWLTYTPQSPLGFDDFFTGVIGPVCFGLMLFTAVLYLWCCGQFLCQAPYTTGEMCDVMPRVQALAQTHGYEILYNYRDDVAVLAAGPRDDPAAFEAAAAADRAHPGVVTRGGDVEMGQVVPRRAGASVAPAPPLYGDQGNAGGRLGGNSNINNGSGNNNNYYYNNSNTNNSSVTASGHRVVPGPSPALAAAAAFASAGANSPVVGVDVYNNSGQPPRRPDGLSSIYNNNNNFANNNGGVAPTPSQGLYSIYGRSSPTNAVFGGHTPNHGAANGAGSASVSGDSPSTQIHGRGSRIGVTHGSAAAAAAAGAGVGVGVGAAGGAGAVVGRGSTTRPPRREGAHSSLGDNYGRHSSHTQGDDDDPAGGFSSAIPSRSITSRAVAAAHRPSHSPTPGFTGAYGAGTSDAEFVAASAARASAMLGLSSLRRGLSVNHGEIAAPLVAMAGATQSPGSAATGSGGGGLYTSGAGAGAVSAGLGGSTRFAPSPSPVPGVPRRLPSLSAQYGGGPGAGAGAAAGGVGAGAVYGMGYPPAPSPLLSSASPALGSLPSATATGRVSRNAGNGRLSPLVGRMSPAQLLQVPERARLSPLAQPRHSLSHAANISSAAATNGAFSLGAAGNRGRGARGGRGEVEITAAPEHYRGADGFGGHGGGNGNDDDDDEDAFPMPGLPGPGPLDGKGPRGGGKLDDGADLPSYSGKNKIATDTFSARVIQAFLDADK